MNKVTEVLNGVTIATIIASLAGFLPPIAALVGIAYYCILIWESNTLKTWRQHRREHKLARLVMIMEHLKQPLPKAPEPEEQLPDDSDSN